MIFDYIDINLLIKDEDINWHRWQRVLALTWKPASTIGLNRAKRH